MRETRESLAAAGDLATPFQETGATGELAADAEAVRTAAEEVAALAAAQRTVAAPAGGDPANRLAITALSTYARGLQTIKDGVSADDAELVGQGQLVAADGERLAVRARQALDELGASCPGAG